MTKIKRLLFDAIEHELSSDQGFTR